MAGEGSSEKRGFAPSSILSPFQTLIKIEYKDKAV
jgi:hypothetical protein